MSVTGGDSGAGRGPGEQPDPSEMSRDDLVRLGSELDDVEIAHREDPFPVPGTRAEKRTERQVAMWFVVAGVAGLAFLVTFIFWPWQYAPPGEGEQHTLYQVFTPLIGIFLGLSVLGMGMGAIAYAKHLLPHETAVQQRHDGRSSEVDRATVTAIITDAGATSNIARRSLIKRAAGFGATVMGLGVGGLALGGLLKDPWEGGDQADLWITQWYEPDPNVRVYLRRDVGDPHEVSLVKAEDLSAGAIETVYPFREAEREDDEALSAALKTSDSPVMLIRLRPEQAAQVTKRRGQVNFNYGDYYAFSKICTHLGCPTSLYEAQTGKILCPCHQSQFDVTQYGRPVFGPATRSLPQLPLEVDEEGYFYARHDFIEPVGPAFWERRS